MKIEKFTFGVGDRFAHQAEAQLRACMLAAEQGVELVPVWNKSHREHIYVKSEPSSVRVAADAAVAELGWDRPYYVDADHINLDIVEGFLECSDFFTIDVADAIGKPASSSEVSDFVDRHPELVGSLTIPGIPEPLVTTRESVAEIAGVYLEAVKEAGRIYRHILNRKGEEGFITEVSMDETDQPQTPSELLVILAALADEKVPLQTIAPKFTGRFNKGVDYVGDVAQFEKEFQDDLAVLAFAVDRFGLPSTLKLSVHSGSDKFSIYGPIRRALGRVGAGVHVKTAGTTWLEELIGLAEAGGEGLKLVREIYGQALEKQDALCAPYAAVIDIDPEKLPSIQEVNGWSGAEYAAALRHDQACELYNPSFRQLLHVGYKIAADAGDRYKGLLRENKAIIEKNVVENLLERHIRLLFV